MPDLERRRAMRVPMRGGAVFYGETGSVFGKIENMSQTGALLDCELASDGDLHGGADATASPLVALKLGDDSGWVRARPVRIEPIARRHRIAVTFERVEPSMRFAIDVAIASALRAALRRPIVVLDDRRVERAQLSQRLTARGMTPMIPTLPLDALDMLARSELHVDVCLIRSSFGQSAAELRALLSEQFPWVSTAEITDDLDATVDRAVDAWSRTDGARLAAAVS